MKISIVVAYGKNREIGFDNKMLWHVPEDFKNFKKITTGHHILMGRKTFESIGRPLPQRVSMVLSKSDFSHPGVEVFKDEDEAIEFFKASGQEELFIVGGAEIYKAFLPYADKLYISEIDYSGKADAYFPEFDKGDWKMKTEVYYEKTLKGEKEVPSWIFRVYEKSLF